MATKKEPNFQIPKKMGECADLMYELRTQRLKLEADAEAIKKNEGALKQHFIDKLGKDQAAKGIVGEFATVRVLSEIIPVATDWESIQEFMKENDAMDLVQRRLSDKAVKERWEAGVAVPGIDKMSVGKVSVTKNKA